MYGADYGKAAGILAVAVWYITFGHYGSVRNIWILAEGKQKYLTAINLAGALANVVLNLCFIPIFGAIGAAIASVITQFFTNVIIGFILRPIQRNNYLMVKALNPKILLDMVEKFAQKIK